MNYKKLLFYIILIVTIPFILGIGMLISFISVPILILIILGYLFLYDTYFHKKKD
jgi:predicted membrane protein